MILVYFTRQALATVNRAACVTLTMYCLTAINQLVKRKVLTMAEYIEREAAIDAIMKVYVRTAGYKARERVFEAEEAVHRLPVADVAPVVYGRWAHIGGDEWCCSACGFVITTEGSWDKPTKKYCEDCGARMDGDSDALD